MSSISEEELVLEKQRKREELKRKALNFYNELGVPNKIEQILNEILYEKPTDVYGRLSEFFSELQITPKIEDVKVQFVFDSIGQPAVKCTVMSIIKNHMKELSSCQVSMGKEQKYRNEPETIQDEANKTEIPRIEVEMGHQNACHELITTKILPSIQEIPLFDQEKIDEIIRSIILEGECELMRADEEARKQVAAMLVDQQPAQQVKKGKGKKEGKKVKSKIASTTSHQCKANSELRLKGCSAAYLASFAIFKSACDASQRSYYDVIHEMKRPCEDFRRLPVPVVSVVSAGVDSPGKANLMKNILLVGSPKCSASKNISKMCAVYQTLGKTLSPKTPVGRASNGAYLSNFERFEQIINVVVDSINQSGLAAGEDLFVGFECDTERIYNNGKYEVQVGVWKTTEEMVQLYHELINKNYPMINLIVDPLHRIDFTSDQGDFMPNILHNKCMIVGSESMLGSAHCWHGDTTAAPKTLKHQLGRAVTSGGANTFTDVINKLNEAKVSGKVTMVTSIDNCEVNDDVIVDVAAGLECTFLKVGAPLGGENFSKLNKLIEIEDNLLQNENITVQYEDIFKCRISSFDRERTISIE